MLTKRAIRRLTDEPVDDALVLHLIDLKPAIRPTSQETMTSARPDFERSRRPSGVSKTIASLCRSDLATYASALRPPAVEFRPPKTTLAQ